MRHHLIFYDGECGLCDRAVWFVFSVDKKKQFFFAPLQGKTASYALKTVPATLRNKDSVILIENYGTPEAQIYFLGKAALRILWLLGDGWSLVGAFSFLPGWLYDWAYRIVARNRHKIQGSCFIPPKDSQNRFLS